MSQQARSISELRSLSDEQLIEAHDTLASHTMIGVDYYLAEAARRDVEKQGRLMIRLTRVIGALTAVDVVAVVVGLIVSN